MEPDQHGPPAAGRWADYLDWAREEIIAGVLGLSPSEQRTSRLSSGWTPIELLSHVLHMEQRWFVWGFLGEQVDQPWGDWSTPEPWTSDDSGETRSGARWLVPEGTDATDLAERLRALGQRTRTILLERPLEARGAPSERFGEEPPSLEWTCFHVLTEYTRHAGHLDVARELASTGVTSPTSP